MWRRTATFSTNFGAAGKGVISRSTLPGKRQLDHRWNRIKTVKPALAAGAAPLPANMRELRRTL
jgi:hypothetical protein